MKKRGPYYSLGLFVIRLGFGAILLRMGIQHYQGDILALGQNIAKIGINYDPYILGLTAIGIELLSGILFILGFLTSGIGFILFIYVATNIIIATQQPIPDFDSFLVQHLSEFMLSIIAIAMLLGGAGRHSIDHALFFKKKKKDTEINFTNQTTQSTSSPETTSKQLSNSFVASTSLDSLQSAVEDTLSLQNTPDKVEEIVLSDTNETPEIIADPSDIPLEENHYFDYVSESEPVVMEPITTEQITIQDPIEQEPQEEAINIEETQSTFLEPIIPVVQEEISIPQENNELVNTSSPFSENDYDMVNSQPNNQLMSEDVDAMKEEMYPINLEESQEIVDESPEESKVEEPSMNLESTMPEIYHEEQTVSTVPVIPNYEFTDNQLNNGDSAENNNSNNQETQENQEFNNEQPIQDSQKELDQPQEEIVEKSMEEPVISVEQKIEIVPEKQNDNPIISSEPNSKKVTDSEKSTVEINQKFVLKPKNPSNNTQPNSQGNIQDTNSEPKQKFVLKPVKKIQ